MVFSENVYIEILCLFMLCVLDVLLLLLQRGTGLSTPLTPSSMQQIKSAQNLADYLKYFRADSIVNDAEFIRVRIVPDARPWTVLGQVLLFLILYYR